MTERSGHPMVQRAAWRVPEGKWCLRRELSQDARTGPSIAPSLSARTIPERVKGVEKCKGTSMFALSPPGWHGWARH